LKINSEFEISFWNSLF